MPRLPEPRDELIGVGMEQGLATRQVHEQRTEVGQPIDPGEHPVERHWF